MLTPGTRLGPYEIRSLIGMGGMGEVYRAEDPRLQRDVAMKVLPAQLVSDPIRRQRFTKEAQAASALNHPHIVAVFDVNLTGESPYIIYELVEGSTLRHYLGKPMPMRRAVELAVQIADGLAAAHQVGMMHRDLKPENVIVGRDGRARILDFGLAKLEQPFHQRVGDADTQSIALTHDGNLIGTVNYMSPEQAAGRTTDRRSDVFSFGLILYEMVVGSRPFDRKSPVETMAAIINDDLPLLDPGLPVPLRLTIRRCLEKEPDNRYESTRDLLADLRAQRDDLASMSGISTGPVAPVRRRWRIPWKRIGWLAAAAAAGVLAGVVAAPDGGRRSLSASQFRPLAATAASELWPAWSPDGKSVAYQAAVDGVSQIFTRNTDSSGVLQVTRGREQCEFPRWSADGRRLFYRSRQGVFAVGAAGGEPELVLPDAVVFALSSHGDKLAILRRTSNPNGLEILLSSPPGAPPVKYKPAPFSAPDFNGALLSFSPDGERLLFFLSSVANRRPAEFWLLPLLSGSQLPRRVLEGMADSFPVTGIDWLPDGRRVVVAHAVRPDVLRTHISIADLETGRVEPLIAGIGGEAYPTVSPDGARLAYTAMNQNVRIVEIPLNGGPVRDLIATSRMSSAANWSPVSHEFVYVTDHTGEDEIWVADPARGTERPVVTQDSFSDHELPLLDSPVFSPTGDRVAFSRAARIWIAPMTGGAPVRLNQMEGSQLAPTWSPDGKWIAFYSRGKTEGVMKARVGGTGEPVLLHETNRGRCRECTPDWSPRGDWIAYYSEEGTILLPPEPGAKPRVIRKPAFEATGWSRDGATLYGLDSGSGRQRLVAIDVATLRERVLNEVGGNLRLRALWLPGLRLSLSPDGKSIAATSIRTDGDIWIVNGFDPGRSWLARLGLRR